MAGIDSGPSLKSPSRRALIAVRIAQQRNAARQGILCNCGVAPNAEQFFLSDQLLRSAQWDQECANGLGLDRHHFAGITRKSCICCRGTQHGPVEG